jgi:hypothetical protein
MPELPSMLETDSFSEHLLSICGIDPFYFRFPWIDILHSRTGTGRVSNPDRPGDSIVISYTGFSAAESCEEPVFTHGK